MEPPLLYLVTDRLRTAGRPLLDVVDAALYGGVDVVQLREKDLSTAALFALAVQLRDCCHARRARLLINDRVDVALAVRADGVHLPVHSFRVSDARRLLGPRALVGVSTHDLAQLEAAAGADFAVFGPVFDTPSKRAFGPPQGLDRLAEAAQVAPVPLLAIGGVDAERAPMVCQRGARGVAVIGAILEAADPARAAAALRAAL